MSEINTAYSPANAELIPQAVEVERALLGALITYGDGAMGAVLPLVTPEMFYDHRHEALYREMIAMFDSREPIELISLTQRVQKNKALSTDLKASEIVHLATSVGTETHLLNHAAIIAQQYATREMAQIGVKIASAASDPSNDIADILAFAGKELDRINGVFAGKASAKHIRSAIQESMHEAEARQARVRDGKSIGVPTGLRDFDYMLGGGWQPSTLNILAARPSMGKTALMLYFAKSAGTQEVPGCIYSLEMSKVSLANRMLLSECEIDASVFNLGRLTNDDWGKLESAAARISRLPIHIDDNPIVSMRYIKAHASTMRRKGLCEWVMIDYLQLADMTSKEKGRNREQEVAETSRMAKIIAKELNIPVILLSQLNRAVESRGDKRPNLSDLRESGAIEQDADTVTFVHRPAYYGKDSATDERYGTIADTRGYGQLLIRKNRDGATGDVSFLHNPSMHHIESYSADRHAELLMRLPAPTQESRPASNYGIDEEMPF